MFGSGILSSGCWRNQFRGKGPENSAIGVKMQPSEKHRLQAVVFTHVQPPVEAVAWPTWICRPLSLSQLPSSMTIQLAVSAVCQ